MRSGTHSHRCLHLALAAGLAACGGAGAQRTGARSRSGARSAATAVAAHTLVVSPIDAPRLLHREPGAASYWAVGGVRVRVRNGAAVAGAQGFASPIRAAVPVRSGGWVFVSAAGTVARASDFVGTLTWSRSLPAPVARAFAWQGGVAALMLDGRLVRVDLPAALPAVARSALASPAAVPQDAPEDESAVAAQAALDSSPASRLALASTALLASGEIALRGGTWLYFATLQTPGALGVSARTALTGETAADCGLRAWGARALLVCPDVSTAAAARTETRAFVADATGVDALGALPRGALRIGREGHTLTVPGACPDAAGRSVATDNPSADATRACTLDRERGWREWQYPAPGAQVLDVYDSRALVLAQRDVGPTLVVYDIDLARAARVLLSEPAAEITRAGFTPDGRVVVLADVGVGPSRRSLAGVARPGELVALAPLGFRARDVAMADRRRGLAVGSTAAELAATSDGGASWERLNAALDGEPARVRFEPPDEPAVEQSATPGARRNGAWVECAPALCRAGGRVIHRWTDGGPVVPPLE